MKQLVDHLLGNNMERIISRSLLNCHTVGLHSVMLLESPEQTIRLYFADENHDLWKNLPSAYKDGMSVGFHPHHCNLTLHVIRGAILNWIVRPGGSFDGHNAYVKQYRYESPITSQEPGFKLVNPYATLKSVTSRELKAGDSFSMSAKSIHTVGIKQGEKAAWLVYEGKEDPEYQSVCYSTSDITGPPAPNLYIKPNHHQVMGVINESWILR